MSSFLDSLLNVNGGAKNSMEAKNHVGGEGDDQRQPGRVIIASNWLPLKTRRDPLTRKWCFEFDEDSLVLQLQQGLWRLPVRREGVYHVGLLDVEISDSDEQEEVATMLEGEFHCIPVFRPDDGSISMYHGFCNRYLWPLFHGVLDVNNNRFDKNMWRAYVSVNRAFVRSIMNAIDVVGDDYVWVHDYNLMVLPSLLRKRVSNLKLGFFVHVPFPPVEIFQTMPVREEILRGLLNCDLVGFHLYDYGMKFLVCCRRLLGLDYELRYEDIVIEHNGRVVSVLVQPVGICVDQIEAVKALPDTAKKVKELKEKFEGKFVIIGVDDVDVLKGIGSKFKAMGQLLEDHPEMRGGVVLVQILKEARSLGADIREVEAEIYEVATEINGKYGGLGYDPIICIRGQVSIQEKVAYYAISRCCLVNSMKDGMNLVPFKYTLSRQGSRELDEVLGISDESDQKIRESVVIISKFVGCSRSLTGAIWVNPWDIDSVSNALYTAITMPPEEKETNHKKNYKYVYGHDIAIWARKFLQALERACDKNARKRCLDVGFGLRSSVLAYRRNVRSLRDVDIVRVYDQSNSRLILLDCDGTVMPQAETTHLADSMVDRGPSCSVISLINRLCRDPKNVVFIVSGRGKDTLDTWFAPCKNLGLSAEHGLFTRWNGDSPWEKSSKLEEMDFGWKKTALDVMELQCKQTDGSYIEHKDSGLVWHHGEADYGPLRAKELLDDLTSLLAEEPVVVKKGLNLVEARAQGLGKGMVAKNLTAAMEGRGKQPDFILCIGNDQSDEEMFAAAAAAAADEQRSSTAARVRAFPCTVGKNPSLANYYLEDTEDAVAMLNVLAMSKGVS